MLSEEEIEKAKEIMKHWVEYEKQNKGKINKADELIEIQETLLQHIKQLEQENRKLKIALNNGLDKDKKTCFYEDGHTGRCLGYSFFNNDEPCIYCKTCEALSIKEED